MHPLSSRQGFAFSGWRYSVSLDGLETQGKLLPAAAQRDAVHWGYADVWNLLYAVLGGAICIFWTRGCVIGYGTHHDFAAANGYSSSKISQTLAIRLHYWLHRRAAVSFAQSFSGCITLVDCRLRGHTDRRMLLCNRSAIFQKVINRMSNVSPIAMNAVQMMVGGAMMFILSLFTEEVHLESFASFQTAGSLIYLIVIGSMVGHTLFYWLVAKTNPVFPSTWLYISPPIAVGVGVLFYDETISWITLLGIITIICGTVLVNAGALRQLIVKRRLKR